MTTPTARFMEILYEVFESLPRQGPGNRACARRALASCRDLPASPAVLDLGCGAGGQTLHLAELTDAWIVAVDNRVASVIRLKQRTVERGLSDRIRPIAASIAQPCIAAPHFDLVWSEGALYNIGLDEALRICSGLLRRGGYLAFTDAVWRTGDAPPEVKALFEDDYPTMGSVGDLLEKTERSGLQLVDHFTLPDEAWWDDFYGPMLDRIEALRTTYADDSDALAALDELEKEPALHQRNAAYYAYEFVIARRPRAGT